MKKKRIAIIDHHLHQLFVEDVDMDLIKDTYNNNIERYIIDTYTCLKPAEWDWDHIDQAIYIPLDTDPINIDFEEALL